MGRKWKERVKQRLKSRRGFTLIEMIITTALVSIFFAAVAMIVPSWYKAYTSMSELNHARQIADNVMEAVEWQIRFADEVRYEAAPVDHLEGRNGSGSFCIPMWEEGDMPVDGIENSVMIDGLAYDADYFMNHELKLSFSDPAGTDYCTVTVEILRKQGDTVETIFTKERSIELTTKNH